MRNAVAHEESIRRDLEQLWDIKLQHARDRFCKASAEFHRNLMETGGGAAEGSPAIESVRRAEAEAFVEYCRVLATFTELVATGKMPGADRTNLVVMPRGLE